MYFLLLDAAGYCPGATERKNRFPAFGNRGGGFAAAR